MVNLVCEAIIPDGPMKELEDIENSIRTVYRKPIWNKFIKEDCKFMNLPMSFTQGDGYIIVYYECLEDYYNIRIKQINKMINDIK